MARLGLFPLLALAACAHHHAPPTVAATAPPLVVHADPQLIELSADASTSAVIASATSELGVRLRIVGKQVPDARRAPINLALVVDTSGSMAGPSIEAVRASARQLI
ncbi:MAG TPA: hypothetical protein VLX92_04120, partial [Kofleriaceae bacterium]|nr:hypothetical protein [Kofleriaceae bacterium]